MPNSQTYSGKYPRDSIAIGMQQKIPFWGFFAAFNACATVGCGVHRAFRTFCVPSCGDRVS